MIRLRDIDVKKTLTTRPTTIGGAVLLVLVVLFFIDDVLILLVLTIMNPLLGLAALLIIVGVWAWRTDRIG